MARKKKHEEHVNHERWLVSYADFITLLFAFFVTMYAISQVDAKKLGKLVESMQSAFDTRVFEAGSQKLSLSDGSSKGIEQQKLVEPITPLVAHSEPSFQKIQANIQSRLSKEQARDKVRFTRERRGLVVSLTEAAFFDPGDAELKGSSLAVLDIIAESILTIPNQIRVEGHTDTTPIHNSRFPSNWELSTARATYILSYLMSRVPFEPARMAVAGYGEFRPISPNNTVEGRAMNRRVDLVILGEEASKQEQPQ